MEKKNKIEGKEMKKKEKGMKGKERRWRRKNQWERKE
jgi:hypothetical protein